MALSGTIAGSYRGYTLQAAWAATQNVGGNYSDIRVTHTLVIGSAYSLKVGARSNSCTVDGVAAAYTSPSINQKGGTVNLGTTTHRVNHNPDGSKTCTIDDVFNINATLDGVKVSSISATANVTLDTIPRQATISTATDFTDEGTPSLTFSNPGGFTASASLVFGGKSITRAGAITAKSGTYTFTLTDAEREALRTACTGQSMQVVYRLTTTIGGTAYTSDMRRTMTIADAAPILGTVAYKDASATVVAVTGNNRTIVQNQSDLQVTFTAATGSKGATISSYSATFAGVTKTASSVLTLDFGKVDVSSSQPLTFTATDSRGITSSTTLTVNVEAWWAPNSTIDLKRVNNFEPTVKVTATAWYANFDGKNTATITAKYRKAGSSDAWAVASLTSGVESTVTCDRDSAYEWQVTTADRLGSTTQTLTLGRGIPTFFIDTSKSSLGVNCFPTSNGVLQLGENAFLTAQGAYPVGAIYLSVNDTDPATLFGGTWERIGGRFLLGADDTYTAGSTGGEAEHTLTIDEMPKHNHEIDNANAAGNATPFMTVQAQDKKGFGGNIQTMYAGGSQPHNNMPPYLAVYMFKRVS